jgi:hypothetical protein
LAQFRNSQDLKKLVLRNLGELEDGTSPFDTIALDMLNQVYTSVLNGGNEFEVEVDEDWDWNRADQPIILELQPKQNTGTLAVTNGSEAGTFSAGPTPSLEGWFLRLIGKDEIFRIVTHVAGGTAFELDAPYPDDTEATASFEAYKLDYDLVAPRIIIDSSNNKIDFEETTSTELTATLTAGSYSPADLATEIDTQLTSAGASAFTVSYDTLTRKFTIASDRAGGGGIFTLLYGTGTNALISASSPLGFDVEDLADAASHESVYALSGIIRLVQPLRVYKRNAAIGVTSGSIHGIDALSLQRDYPMNRIREGVPSHFAVIDEDADGKLKIRFDRYPEEATRAEVEHTPVPRDLKDSVNSIPRLPRKFIDILVNGASYHLALHMEDGKSQSFFQLARQKLLAMQEQHRRALMRAGDYFGSVIPRAEQTDRTRRRLIYGVPESN